MMDVIEVQSLTKDYGLNRGIFDINFSIKKGEMFGFMGTNGSGKTTTIRHIMGFLKPDQGHAFVLGKDSWKYSSDIIRHIGYVPGEIAFPDLKTGTEFLKSQAEFLGLNDLSYAEDLIKKLQLDCSANLKTMSKGMKQKTAIVAALMADPEIIVLDEATTGLDPLMREVFLSIIKEEHQKGKTIFMSSHIFEELETTCDRVALIKDGYIKNIVNMDEIINRNIKEIKVEFIDYDNYAKFKKQMFKIIRDQEKYNQLTIEIEKNKLNELLRCLKDYKVKFITENTYNLERYFKEILMKEEEVKNVL